MKLCKVVQRLNHQKVDRTQLLVIVYYFQHRARKTEACLVGKSLSSAQTLTGRHLLFILKNLINS